MESVFCAPITISGATTIQPVMEDLSAEWKRAGGLELSVRGGGSGRGLSDVASGLSRIGMVSRSLRPDEAASFAHYVFAFDALALLVNERSVLSGLTKAQTVDLFSGKIRSWRDLNGPDERVRLVTKELGRATLDLFEQYIGLNHPRRDKPGPNGYAAADTLEIASNLECAALVGGLPHAVGYLSFGTVSELKSRGMPVKILSYEGKLPTSESIKNGTYPMRRELVLIWKEDGADIRAFLSYLRSAAGRRIVEKHGFTVAE